MVQRTGRFRFKTRHKLRKKPRSRGKLPVNRILQKFRVGDEVRVEHEPSQHKGMPHPKFKNRTGTVKKKKGNSYLVEVRDLNKLKQVISKAVHLRKL